MQRVERIYVKVISIFDTRGTMFPKEIIWPDGRTFKIDSVIDFRPAAALERGRRGDCYTVRIQGEERHLFFERTDPLFWSRLGRWWVERIC